MNRIAALALLSLVAGSLVAGCGADPKVMRVYDGHLVQGHFVPSEAYGAYLSGALAEEAGDLRAALAAYEKAEQADDEDAEIAVRIGDVRCRLDPKDKDADGAFARATKLDRAYAPLYAAKARCSAARGQGTEAVAMAEQATSFDAKNVGLEALLVRLAAENPADAARVRARERAIALTLASGERPAAWEALATWGKLRGEPELLARGLAGLLRTAPMRSPEVEAGVLALLGQGQAALARQLAATIADSPRDLGVVGPRDATVARLAVDEALLRGDRATAERRATRGHVPLGEIAARAMLLEHRDLAAEIARTEAEADPGAVGAHMVLAALAIRDGGTKDKPHPGAKLTDSTHPAPVLCALVVADRLSVLASSAIARDWLSRVSRLEWNNHDPLTGPLAVELAARGVLPASDLPLELAIELAARRREAPPALTREDAVDEKHRFMWHALAEPRGPEAKSGLVHLQAAADRDPIVGFSIAKLALASGAPVAPPILRAISAGPANPLLLAVAVEIAKRTGSAETLPPMRARLMAVAQTPAEHQLAGGE